jgi:hypothetical protein
MCGTRPATMHSIQPGLHPWTIESARGEGTEKEKEAGRPERSTARKREG